MVTAEGGRPPTLRGWRAWGLRLLPWLIMGATLAITGLLWLEGRNQQMEHVRRDVSQEVAKVRTRIEGRLQANAQILRGVAGLFAVSDRIDREQFRDYVESLRLAARYPGIQGVGFARLIVPQDLAAFVQEVRAEGFPDYEVHPPGERASYTAIVYLEPFDWRNQRAFGYDMLSEPVRRAAMVRAWEQGQLSISGKVRLLQETEQDVQAGFLIYLPVYRRGLPHNTDAERRANLLGWVYSPLRMQNLMQSFLQRDYPELAQRLGIAIYDGTATTADGLMFASQSRLAVSAGRFQETLPIDLSGHRWTLHAQTLPAFDRQVQRFTERDWIVLGVGGALSIALSLLAWVLIKTHIRVAAALCETRLAHCELLESQERLRLIFDASEVAIFLTDLEGCITQANERMAEMFNCPMGQLIGSDYVSHIHPAERAIGRQRMRELLAQQTAEVKLERRYWREDGSEFWGLLDGHLVRDGQGQPIGLIGVIADTTQRKEAEARIQFLAHHDYLTGLPNRALFVEQMEQALALAQRYRRQLGLLFLDLDGFKPINDQYGHHVGDEVLREVAARLRDKVRASDTVCRQGGDEFVILVPECPGRHQLEQLAQVLVGVVGEPYEVLGATLSVTVSIGIAIYPDHGEQVDDLLRSADAAMYLAKAAGPGQARFADGQVNVTGPAG
ncbi:CHASE domain-containing protein [uncultured Thiodictyon sp.]|uniref:CHASE domain-containing protein n=1 Tax=uncultured Thiodictyon sp. TaxID=1846217 RepID=UPI0025DA20EC|nr:CHASE domain-containing protein [uncultured Thiodictyon sp.]